MSAFVEPRVVRRGLRYAVIGVNGNVIAWAWTMKRARAKCDGYRRWLAWSQS